MRTVIFGAFAIAVALGLLAAVTVIEPLREAPIEPRRGHYSHTIHRPWFELVHDDDADWPSTARFG
ncbi:MAG: hypothetical protein ACYDCL_14220 [Myxococcales bacterium]